MRNEEIESCIQTLRFLENNFINDHGIFRNDKHPDNIKKIIKFLKEKRWIPVSERLPEASGDYLVTTKWKGRYSGNVYVETNMAEYRKKTKEWDCVDVIAWMPLPSSYQGEENG